MVSLSPGSVFFSLIGNLIQAQSVLLKVMYVSLSPVVGFWQIVSKSLIWKSPIAHSKCCFAFCLAELCIQEIASLWLLNILSMTISQILNANYLITTCVTVMVCHWNVNIELQVSVQLLVNYYCFSLREQQYIRVRDYMRLLFYIQYTFSPVPAHILLA